MKHALIAALLALCLTLGGTITAAALLFQKGDDVTFAETVLYGDPAAFAGAEIAMHAEWENLLFWDTVFRPGVKGSEETQFRSYQSKQYTPGRFSDEGVVLSTDYNVGWSDHPAEEVTGLMKAFNELKAIAKPGEETTKRIRLIDYCDYYPISILVSLGDFRAMWDAQMPLYEANYSYNHREDGEEVLVALAEFFRIPVVPEETMEIHLNISANGMSQSWGMSRGMDNGGDFFPMYSFCAIGEDALYFTFTPRTNRGVPVDTSLIPGGYGIYALPYRTENGVTTVDADGLAMVYPLDPTSEIEKLTRGTAEGTLHLYTKEDGHPVLTVIDTGTMETVQRLELESEACEFFSLLHASEEFIVLITDSSRLVLLTRKEDGMYAHRFTADKEPAGIELPYYGTTHTKWAFDGERLATVQYIRDGYARCNLIAAVYDATGMLSAARYDCSLNAGLSDDNYKYHCQLTGDPVISIRFAD